MTIVPAFDEGRFASLREQARLALGHPLIHTEQTGSTNDDLMASAGAGAPHGTVHLTEFQSRGRGRQGNVWLSPTPHENLLFSVLLRPKFTPESTSSFTLAVGLAVRDAVAPLLHEPVGLKWTNDILVRDHKLSGILVESQFRDSECVALVVGIGLNVHMTALPPELLSIATSLRLLGARTLDREQLLVDILLQLERRTRDWERNGLRSVLGDLREHDAINGRRVRVAGREGWARGIDDSGALLLEVDPSQPCDRLTSGLVELLENDPHP